MPEESLCPNASETPSPNKLWPAMRYLGRSTSKVTAVLFSDESVYHLIWKNGRDRQPIHLHDASRVPNEVLRCLRRACVLKRATHIKVMHSLYVH